MSRITSVFTRPGHTAFIPYITVGYPNVDATLKIVPVLAECGCDIIELGIPFSDPLADGTTIQKASFQALQNGVTPERCLDIADQLRQKVQVPLVFMSYYNPIFNYGLERFCIACARSGIDGLIIPDMPPEEGSDLESLAYKHDIGLIYLLSPSSTEERIRLIAHRSRAFISLVSLTGVTGTRSELSTALDAFVARVRAVTNQPLCVGFGISTRDQATRIAKIADGVIIGSRIIQIMESGENYLTNIRKFATGIRNALDKK